MIKERPEEPIAERYAPNPAECAAQLGLPTRPPPRPEPARQRGGPARRAIDLVADYCRRMVDLAESSPDDPAARDALLWVIDKPAEATWGRMATNSPARRRCSSAITAMTPMPSASA